MGKWVSIYFRNAEYERLTRVVERESRKRGRRVSAYEIVKEWVMDRLRREDGEENAKAD